MSLANKYRPKTYAEMKGNYEYLEGYFDKPDHNHAIALVGQSGGGKSTIKNIMIDKLGADPIFDVHDFNFSSTNGIDTARDILSKTNTNPMGKAVVFILEEFHGATDAAQRAFLDIFENPPKYIYFIILTTNPEKLNSKLLSRCTFIKINPVSEEDLLDLLIDVCYKEEYKVSKKVLEYLAEMSSGSARKALNTLHSIVECETNEEKMEKIGNIANESSSKNTIDLCRCLFGNSNMGDMLTVLKELESNKENPESIRLTILSYGMRIMLNGNIAVGKVMEYFTNDFFSSGFPGLTMACVKAIATKK